jgi:dephospho-CoA kinase
MKRIAIVGEIGSGKTFAAKLFGLPTFNADNEVNKIYNKNRIAYKKLRKKLPQFISSFPIRKNELSNAVGKDMKNLKIITKIVHPLVRQRMNFFLTKNKKKGAVILDIPLYFENKINKNDDVVIFIEAQKKKINKALKKRQRSNTNLLKKLGILQISKNIKKRRSDYVIKNDFNSENLKKKVKILKEEILRK